MFGESRLGDCSNTPCPTPAGSRIEPKLTTATKTTTVMKAPMRARSESNGEETSSMVSLLFMPISA
jgi:hypothetical protein